MHPKVDTPQGYNPLDNCVLKDYALYEAIPSHGMDKWAKGK